MLRSTNFLDECNQKEKNNFDDCAKNISNWLKSLFNNWDNAIALDKIKYSFFLSNVTFYKFQRNHKYAPSRFFNWVSGNFVFVIKFCYAHYALAFLNVIKILKTKERHVLNKLSLKKEIFFVDIDFAHIIL